MNEKQRDGMERAGETGEVPQRRSTDGKGIDYSTIAGQIVTEFGLSDNAADYSEDWLNGMAHGLAKFAKRMGELAAAPVAVTLPKDTGDALLSLRAACDWIGQQDGTYGLTQDVAKSIDKLEAVLAAPVVAVVAAEITLEQIDAVVVVLDALIPPADLMVTYARACKASNHLRAALASQAQAAPSAPVDEFPRSEQVLRRLLAYRCAGTKLYTDDGELQDTSAHPWIDFKRDSVDSIEENLGQRAGLAAQAAVGVAKGDFLPTREVHDEIVLLSNVMREHPQLKPVIGREALLMRCVRKALAGEQQPQPSCNAALRAAPEMPVDAGDTAFLAAIGRALADRNADICGVNKDDNWKIYGGEFIEDAKVVLEAICRFRAQGGNTNDKASPDLASIASQAHKPLTEKQRGNIKLAAHTLKMNGSAKLANSLLGILSATTPTES